MKGQDILIKALSLIHHRNTSVVLLGSAEGHEHYRDKLLQYAASLGLEGRVKWMAPSADMVTAYKVSDLVVSPSKLPEGFGRTMAEAQAMEKPIISASHGAAHEIIKDGVTGWLTPPKNAIALAKVLDIALGQPQADLLSMGKKGRERIEALYSIETMTTKTINVYKELLQHK
jgi:glycosyltransferase involved in cell wall biosynthesis